MELAYICSPYRASSEAELDRNIEYAQELTSRALKAGYAPITPHLYITAVLNDNIPKERELGLEAGKAILRKCDVMIIGERYGISEGMKKEIKLAEDLGFLFFYDDES